MARQSAGKKRELVADLCEVIFSQTGHFHDSIAVNAVLQHGTGNFRHCCKVSDEGSLLSYSKALFQKLCLPGAFRPDHHNKMLRHGLCVSAHHLNTFDNLA